MEMKGTIITINGGGCLGYPCGLSNDTMAMGDVLLSMDGDESPGSVLGIF